MRMKNTAAVDVAPEQQEQMMKELLNATVDAMKLGGGDTAVESALKKARDSADAHIATATRNLKPGSTREKAREVAGRAVQMRLPGDDARETVEAVTKRVEDKGNERKPGQAK